MHQSLQESTVCLFKVFGFSAFRAIRFFTEVRLFGPKPAVATASQLLEANRFFREFQLEGFGFRVIPVRVSIRAADNGFFQEP